MRQLDYERSCKGCGRSSSEVMWSKGAKCYQCDLTIRVAKKKERYHTNPEARAKQIIHSQNVRADKLKIPRINVEEGAALLLSIKECPYCFLPNDGQAVFNIDHIVPVSKGGTNDLSNLTVCCEWCNGIKRNKTKVEFLAWLKGAASRVASSV